MPDSVLDQLSLRMGPPQRVPQEEMVPVTPTLREAPLQKIPAEVLEGYMKSEALKSLMIDAIISNKLKEEEEMWRHKGQVYPIPKYEGLQNI